MTPIATARTVLETTRESLYRLADRAPSLSPRLTAATLAITAVLGQPGDGGPSDVDPYEALLVASNILAAAQHDAAGDHEAQLQLADAFGVLSQVRQLVAPGTRDGAHRHLRLVHSS